MLQESKPGRTSVNMAGVLNLHPVISVGDVNLKHLGEQLEKQGVAKVYRGMRISRNKHFQCYFWSLSLSQQEKAN